MRSLKGKILGKVWWLLSLLCLSSCVSYRVVELGPGVTEGNIVSPFYAVTRNSVVIPEYVVDRYGNYPTSPEEATRRFEQQRGPAEPLIAEKYQFPSPFPRDIPRYFLGICFALVSPVALPVQWISEAFSASESKRSFSKTAHDYFNASFNPLTYERPQIRERIDYFY